MRNKKGFTLIEMLVVIAIIAVLVAIIIPTVTNATTKAAAATNAANLRALIAEATTDYIAGKDDSTGLVTYDADAKTFDVSDDAPTSKKCGDVAEGAEANITVDASTGLISANYGENATTHAKYDVDYFADIAE